MINKLRSLPAYLTTVVILAAMMLAGCGSSQPAASSSGQSAPAATTPGQSQPGQQDRQALQKKIISRAAEILVVSADTLTTAYEAARTSVMGDRVPSASNQGTPPPPPTDNRTRGPGGQGRAPDMSGVYSKVAETLGLTVDKVTAAFEQARKELMPARTQQ